MPATPLDNFAIDTDLAMADAIGYSLTNADRKLDSAYGDHVHQNAGLHLTGGVDDDATWQHYWLKIASINTKRYDLPKTTVGKRFLSTLRLEFVGVRERKWNSERVIVFMATILQTTPNVTKACDIKRRISSRLDAWAAGEFSALVSDTERECTSATSDPPSDIDINRAGRSFHTKLVRGRVRQAVRHLTNRASGGVIDPDGVCTKTGRPVIDVLRDEHPQLRMPDADDPDGPFGSTYAEMPDQLAVDITGETIEKAASNLFGSGSCSGVDAADLQHWLLCFGKESSALRDEMATWTRWLSNTRPPWAAYRALMACRLVPLDKQPGVRPVGIGEIFRRLFASALVLETGSQATDACGTSNLSVGLKAGIEAAAHAMAKIFPSWDSSAPSTATDNEAPSTSPPSSPSSSGAPSTGAMHSTTVSADAMMLVDARNAFNELNRIGMLWTVRHLWPAGSIFAFNCYRHYGRLIVRRSGQSCIELESQEGVTQGDPLAMILYGLGVSPIANRLSSEVPTGVPVWFADNCAVAGPVSALGAYMGRLVDIGPSWGYFPEPTKSIIISRAEQRAQLQQQLADFKFIYSTGHRYIGTFVGDRRFLRDWLQPQIDDWVAAVKDLANVSGHFPQSAYAGLVKALQNEWTYIQRLTPNIGPYFAPVESAIHSVFIKKLMGDDEVVGAKLCSLTSLSTRRGGLAICNPVTNAKHHYQASVAATSPLVDAITTGAAFNVPRYKAHAITQKHASRDTKAKTEEEAFFKLLESIPSNYHRALERAWSTGSWLTTMPNIHNGTILSRDEFRDSLRWRLTSPLLSFPSRCDGCDARFTVSHALCCKRGGLVTLRHNEIAEEWASLCSAALSSGAVSTEPYINNGRSVPNNTSASQTDPVLQGDQRGDVGVRGFWSRANTTIFDVQVCDTDAPSYANITPARVLENAERRKKAKHLDPCLQQRKHFTPLVFSVDGVAGREATSAIRNLAKLLSAKWNRAYSHVCGYIRSRLSLSLVRAFALCIRGSRDPTTRAARPFLECGASMVTMR